MDPACARYTPQARNHTKKNYGTETFPTHKPKKSAKASLSEGTLDLKETKTQPIETERKERHKRTGVRMMQGMINRLK